VHEGQEATVSLSYLPGRSFRGKVLYVYPTLDEKTRTVKVRLEVPNADQSLKPGMFADVILRSEMGRVLVVPDAALLDSGLRQIVFVSLGEGRFAPRVVKPGRRAGGQTEILSGLDQGERVVAAANFMLDAESKLSEAVGGTGHAGHGKAEEK
jgi:RND family efflux transporter MFP subunit